MPKIETFPGVMKSPKVLLANALDEVQEDEAVFIVRINIAGESALVEASRHKDHELAWAANLLMAHSIKAGLRDL